MSKTVTVRQSVHWLDTDVTTDVEQCWRIWIIMVV